MKIEIEWISDVSDCETCGNSYADGAIIKIDGEVAIDMTPFATCYDGVSFSEGEVYKALLEHLGHDVEESSSNTGYDYTDGDENE